MAEQKQGIDWSTPWKYGLEVVFWALLFGLFISNVIGVPEWLKTAVKFVPSPC